MSDRYQDEVHFLTGELDAAAERFKETAAVSDEWEARHEQAAERVTALETRIKAMLHQADRMGSIGHGAFRCFARAWFRDMVEE